MSACPSVKAGIVSKRLDKSSSFLPWAYFYRLEKPLDLYPTLYYEEIYLFPKIKVPLFGIYPKIWTLNIEFDLFTDEILKKTY